MIQTSGNGSSSKKTSHGIDCHVQTHARTFSTASSSLSLLSIQPRNLSNAMDETSHSYARGFLDLFVLGISKRSIHFHLLKDKALRIFNKRNNYTVIFSSRCNSRRNFNGVSLRLMEVCPTVPPASRLVNKKHKILSQKFTLNTTL
jgi:hypothetical protein